MADPISGAGGGAAKVALQQLQQMQNMKPPTQTPQAGAGGSQFSQLMQKNQNLRPDQVNKVNDVQKMNKTNRTRSVRDLAKVNKVNKAQAPSMKKVSGVQKNDSLSGLKKILENLTKKNNEVDDIMKKAMNGKIMNNKEMLVVQYKMSQFTLEMDLTSKMVEKSTNAIKQAMNTQV